MPYRQLMVAPHHSPQMSRLLKIDEAAHWQLRNKAPLYSKASSALLGVALGLHSPHFGGVGSSQDGIAVPPLRDYDRKKARLAWKKHG
jgi:hypothetical protein